MQTKYIKYINKWLLMVLVALATSVLLFSSCNDDDDDAISGTVLESFGPMPIARGAELSFIGYNLDMVSAVVVPPNIEITDFSQKTAELLMVTVPQTATEGFVTLKTPGGDITTKTKITYSEPISIDGFAPQTIKPGQELTINGDYLNLVKTVIFTDRIMLGDSAFTSQSRKELKLLVPAESQSGKIAVSNGAEDPIIIYSTTDLVVTTPVFQTIAPNPAKAGTNLSIAGTDLDLVTKVELGGGKMITDFVSQSETSIELKIPDDTKDGIVKMFPASMVAIESAEELIMVIPTVSVTPTTVKNGGEIMVTGTDLDLVSKVIFGGDAEGTITNVSETEMTVMVPNTAVGGVVRFVTKADKEVSGPEITIVDPTITGINPVSAKPNTDIVISGTDLDLVQKVIFSGDVEGTIVTQTETEITATIPVGAVTGPITVIPLNEMGVTSEMEIEVLQNLPNFESYTESKAVPGKILTINGTKMDLIKELVFPDNITATAYGIKTDTQIEVYVPEDATTGYGVITMITYEGEEGVLPEIYIGGTDPVLDEQYVFFDFNGTGSKDSWWGNAINSGIKADPDNSVDGSSFWNIDGWSGTGWWDGLFFRNGSNNFVTDGIDVATDVYKFEVNVREVIYEGQIKFRMGNSSDDGGDGYWYSWAPWNGMPDGYKTEGWISVEIPLSEFKDGSGNTMPDAAKGGSEFGWIWSWGTSVKVNMGIDNIRFEKK